MKGLVWFIVGLPCAMILMPLTTVKTKLEELAEQDKMWWIVWGIVYLIGLPLDFILRGLENI